MNFITTVQYNGFIALSKGMTKKLQLTITSLAPLGDGISIRDGQFHYVPGGIPGDIVEAEIIRKNKKETYTRLLRIVEPSSHRREASCPVFDKCGGCSLLMADESLQRNTKEQTLARQFSFDRVTLVTAGPPLGYRRLARLHMRKTRNGNVQLGFFEKKAHRIADISRCPILDNRISDILLPLKNGMLSGLDTATVRIASGNEGVFVQVETESPPEPRFYEEAAKAVPGLLKGVVLNWNGISSLIAGAATLTLSTAGGEAMQLPVGSFGQANAHINEKLVATASNWIRTSGEKRLLELYAGSGNFSCNLQHNLDHITLVELDRDACEVAKLNFKNDKNINVICDDALAAYRRVGLEAPVVLLDPPRTGAMELAMAMAEGHHKLIIYVSCNPATLKRDLAYLHRGGYALRELVGFDMFPQTAHLEVAARLSKDEA